MYLMANGERHTIDGYHQNDKEVEFSFKELSCAQVLLLRAPYAVYAEDDAQLAAYPQHDTTVKVQHDLTNDVVTLTVRQSEARVQGALDDCMAAIAELGGMIAQMGNTNTIGGMDNG